MITKFRTSLYAAGCLSLACISALSLTSCGGSDSDEDLSHTIPVLPETVEELVGYELRGPIEMQSEPVGIYDEEIELVDFLGTTLVNITLDDNVTRQTNYSFVDNGDGSVTITIDVPVDALPAGVTRNDTYVLVLTQPSTYYQVQLDGTSVYQVEGGASYPLYAENGSLNFLKPN